MQPYQLEFIETAIRIGVLKFGDFVLKSGRSSPYFFNMGLFDSGNNLAALGHYYAQSLFSSGVHFGGLFGPAYKGIPLVSTTAIALSERYNIDARYTFDRKEIKDHGEGGLLIGAPLEGDIVIIDDVISSGISVREAAQLITKHDAKVAGIVIALDRQERGSGQLSAVQEVEQSLKVPVISVIKLDDLMEYLTKTENMQQVLSKIADYRTKYGAEFNRVQ